MDDTERITRDLLDKVNENAQSEVERGIASGPFRQQTLSYEVFLPSLLETTLSGNHLALKLLQCEINTLSPFHLAALLGKFDLLMTFIGAGVDAEAVLESGTTALHLAAFGGHKGTVDLLCTVYKVDVNKQDRYGWSALHYVSTEGHMEVVEYLVKQGADISKRDKDGTCAALRAQWQGFENIVAYFCQLGEEDDLLNIEEVPESPTQKDPQYAAVNKPKQGTVKKAPPRSASFSAEQNNNTTESTAGVQMRKGGSSKSLGAERPKSDFPSSAGAASKSATLPHRFKEARNSRIRRVIQKELEAAFSDYQNPADIVGAASGKRTDEDDVIMAGVGIGTMTRLMREEIQKYKGQILNPVPLPPKPQFTAGSDIKEEDDEYESLYETLKGFGQAPVPPGQQDEMGGAEQAVRNAPPLPPRNPQEETSLEELINSVSIKGQPTSMALNAAIRKLAQILGSDWKKLARALPIHSSPSRCEDRIKKIEKEHLGNTERQAVQALLDWRLSAGRAAEVDALIIAMRKCGLHDKIEEMEMVTSEFTA